MGEARLARATYDSSIFLNCPFDQTYKPIFDALVFAAFDCGFAPRCALEVDDGGQVRIEKIISIIQACRFGAHDISRTELDSENQLPRFNMPFELGLFVGAARFGKGDQGRKVCLILDRDRYRFQKFISDIAGQDIAAHRDDPEEAIKALRKWLSMIPTEEMLPGGAAIVRRYRVFQDELPQILAKLNLEAAEVTFADYANIVEEWLVGHPRSAK
jgi:hypothetical protein